MLSLVVGVYRSTSPMGVNWVVPGEVGRAALEQGVGLDPVGAGIVHQGPEKRIGRGEIRAMGTRGARQVAEQGFAGDVGSGNVRVRRGGIPRHDGSEDADDLFAGSLHASDASSGDRGPIEGHRAELETQVGIGGMAKAELPLMFGSAGMYMPAPSPEVVLPSMVDPVMKPLPPGPIWIPRFRLPRTTDFSKE